MIRFLVFTTLCTLVAAGLLELIHPKEVRRLTIFANYLMAGACFALATRLGYLVVEDDLGRLSTPGSTAILAMALSRVIARIGLLTEPPAK